MGTGYVIDGAQNSAVQGVAVLGKDRESVLSPILEDSDAVTGLPKYASISPLLGTLTGGYSRLQEYGSASFDKHIERRGGLLTLSDAEGISQISRPATGGARQVNVQTGFWAGGGLSIGEWTDGSLQLGSGSVPQTVTLASNQFMPYIIGTPVAAPSGNLYVEYSLKDLSQASAARVAAGGSMTGTLDALTLGLDLDSALLYLKDFKVTLTPAAGGNQTVYTATGVTGLSMGQHGFSTMSGITTQSNQDVNCAEGGCATKLDGFFTGLSGGLLGTGYVIDGAQNSAVQGVAVLGKDAEYQIRPALTDTATGASTGISPLYSFASAVDRADAAGQLVTLDVLADFEQAPGANQGGLLSLKENVSAPTSLLNHGTTGYSGLMTDLSAGVSVGEMTKGTLTFAGESIGLSALTYMPYVIGVNPTVIPDSNLKVTYSLHSLDGASFATRPRFNDGTGPAASSLDKLNLTLNLSEGLMDVDLKVTTGTDLNQTVYIAQKNDISFPSLSSGNGFQLDKGGLTATSSGSDSTCADGCDAYLAGFMTGNSGDMLGVTYGIVHSDTRTLGGAAVVGKTGETVIPSTFDKSGLVADDYLGQTTALFEPDALLTGGRTIKDASVSFSQSRGDITELTHTVNNVTRQYGRIAGQPLPVAADVRHHRNTLAWGRWTSTTASVYYDAIRNGLPLVGTALRNDNIHYLVGQASPTGSGSAIENFTAQGLVVTYSLAGGTAPTSYQLLPGQSAPASTVGTLTGGQVIVDFGIAKSAFTLGMTMPGADAQNNPVTASINVNSGGFTGTLNGSGLAFNQLTVSNNDVTCATCSGSASGFIAGANADMVGLRYNFTASPATPTSDAATVSGVAAFDSTLNQL